MTKNPTFVKFRERFNLQADFFSTRNLEQLIVDSRKLFAKLNKKNAFTHHVNRINDLIPFINAIEVAMPTLGKNLRLTIYDKEGLSHQRFITKNTLGAIIDVFDEHVEPAGSEGDLFRGYNNVSSIRVEFVDKKLSGKLAPGYFPYWNLSKFDLSRYGIYQNEKHPCINQSCLVTAFDESEILTADELLMLRSFVRTRHVLREDIKYIAELLNIDIKVECRKITKELKDGHNNTKVYCNGNIYDVKDYNKITSTNRKISLLFLKIFETFEHCILVEPVEEEIVYE